MINVSVIIPNYNHTRFLRAAIQSVLAQTYRTFEIIVIDDGSTDNSREVVAEFGEQVRYIWQENQGLAGARNTGILAARGDYIGLLDADDQWRPDFLKAMTSLIDQHPDGAVYYCLAQSMDVNGCDLPQVFGGPVLPPDSMFAALLRANFLIPSTVVLRRSVALSVGLFDRSLRSCEDWDLWLRLLPKVKFFGTYACLVRYRIHSDTLSTNLAGMQFAARSVIEKQFGSDTESPSTWSKAKQRAYGGLYRYCMISSIQRQTDWQVASSYFQKALHADPELALDLDLFYDLSLGSQPSGLRGSPYQLDLETNKRQLIKLLSQVFEKTDRQFPRTLVRQAFGTAFMALGLVHYNSGYRSLCRRFLLKAIYYRPDLLLDRRVIGNGIKSFVSQSKLDKIKKRLRLNDFVRYITNCLNSLLLTS
jgi:glycosyltransferase involved in cell wall biosynthesis